MDKDIAEIPTVFNSAHHEELVLKIGEHFFFVVKGLIYKGSLREQVLLKGPKTLQDMDEKELNKAMEMPAGLQNLGDHKNDYFLANSIDNSRYGSGLDISVIVALFSGNTCYMNATIQCLKVG